MYSETKYSQEHDFLKYKTIMTITFRLLKSLRLEFIVIILSFVWKPVSTQWVNGIEKFNVNFKVVVALLVFQKELFLSSQNISISDKEWVGGDGAES